MNDDDQNKNENTNENEDSSEGNKENEEEGEEAGVKKFDGDDEGEEDAEETAEKVQAGVKKALLKIKEAIQTAIKIIKWILKMIIKLIKAGPPGWIVLFVIFVICMILILVASFNNGESNGDESGNRSTYDTQDMISNQSFFTRVALRIAKEKVRHDIRKDLTRDEYKEMREGILGYEEDELNVYDDNLWSYYNEDYGYQILSDEASQLLLAERLTYSYGHTDWVPTYDYGHELEDQIIALEAEIEANEGTWPKIKTQEKKEELEDLKVKQMKLDFKVERYKQINEMYWDYITTNFIENEEVQSKFHPDGEPVEEKILAFYKDKYGVNTEDVESELNYYHTIMRRNCFYEKEIEAPDATKIEEFLKEPLWTTAEMKEEHDYGTSVQDVEYQFRVKYELLHHEAVLNSIRNEHIVNDVLSQTWSKQHLKESIFKHMPVFEYYTYDWSVPVKTFNEYEMYDPAYWDAEGNYVDDGTFDSVIELYMRGGDYDTDYSDVVEAQNLSFMRDTWINQINEQGEIRAADPIAVNELEIEIDKANERLAELGDPEELNEEYKERFAKFLEASVYNKEGERVINPHNHNVKLDAPDKQKVYMKYGNLMVDNYVEDTHVVETIFIGSTSGIANYGGWVNSSYVGDYNSGTKTVKSTTKVEVYQTSLKPTKVRSVLNSADYTYEKEEEREWDVAAKLDEKRPTTPWQERTVTYQGGGTGVQYKHETIVDIHNWGTMTPTVNPWASNQDMLLVNSTYLSDFYGQTQIIATETELRTDGQVDFDRVFR